MIKMEEKIKDKLIIILGIIVVIFVIFLIYSFVITPAINAKVTQGYNQGQVDLVNNILSQIQQTGVVRLPISDSQIIVLAPYTS